ncbi:MAG TPA: hypothetical protein VFV20_06550, partial [Candidatus Limnocylindria bacterium]|nr:hypothetical protein [Candidatus Limnocylindria bacterium]
PMDAVHRLMRRVPTAIAGVVRWSLATVDDDTPRNVIPMPGPAHGPVPSITLRVEEQRRRKAS